MNEPTPILNMYSGIQGVTSAENLNQTDRIKLAIVGRVKVGKSWLAATMPGEKYFFDFDNRKASLAGKKNTFAKTYQDSINTMPKAAAAFEQDLKMFEYNKQSGKPIPDVFVLDSATWWAKAIENELMKSSSKLQRELKTSAFNILIPNGWDVSTGVRNYMENSIARLSALGHLILIFHEEPEKDKIKSTKEEVVYTGKMEVHPWYLRTLLSTFNETWRLTIVNGAYVVQVKPTNDFGASTTMKLDQAEKADISKMLEKHVAKLAAESKVIKFERLEQPNDMAKAT